MKKTEIELFSKEENPLKIYRLKQAAELCGLSVDNFKNEYVNAGYPVVRFSFSKWLRIQHSDLQKFLEDKKYKRKIK